MRENGNGRRDGNRVTRRGGTKLFGRQDARSAERARVFDDDRAEPDIAVRRRSRDSEDRADYRAFDEEHRAARRRSYDDGYRTARGYEEDGYREDRRPRHEEEYRYERRPRDDDERRDTRRPRYDDRDDARDGGRRRASAQPAPHQTVKTYRTGANTELFLHQIVPYVMFWVALFAAISFILRDIAGLSEGAGVVGNWLADFLNGLLGVAAYLLPLMMMVLALKWKRFVREGRLAKKLVLSSAFLLLLSAIIHVFQDRADLINVVTGSETLFHTGVMRRGGGLFGGFVGEWLGKGLRLPGTCLLAIPLLIIIGIYLVDLTPGGLWQRLRAKMQMMRRQGREERGATAESTQTGGARARVADRDADGGWRQPQPLTAGAYDFHEDEPDVAVTPPRGRADAGEDMDTTELSRRAASAFEGYHSDVAHDILDIPDDEPEMTPPGAAARSILEGAGHHEDSVGQTLADILRDLEEPAAPVTPAQTATATPVFGETPAAAAATPAAPRGDYYAPFALPIRPEPRRERPVTPAATAAQTTPVAEAVTTRPASSEAVSDLPEESLGSRATAPYTPTPSRPAYSTCTPTYKSPAEAYRMDPQVSGFTPVVEEPPAPTAAKTPSPAEAFATRVSESAPTAPESLLDFENFDDAEDLTDVLPELPVTPVAPATSAAVFDRNPFATADEVDAPAEVAPVSVPTPVEPPTPAPEPVVTRESVPDTRPSYEAPVQAPVQSPVQAAAPMPVRTPATATAVRVAPVKAEAPPAPVPRRPYTRPHVGLLAEDQNVRSSDFYEEIEETKLILRDTLESFNIHIQDQISYSHGPSVTRYELRPVAGTSVRSVTNRIDDIALNLAASVRIEAPIPGKPAIGIEVPNKVRETVYMRTMLESEEYRRSFKPLEVPLGLDVGGAVRMCNLAAMPHLLIAGTTGSGKSVCINSILLSLIFKTSPDDLRLILIDPKQIEFAPYEHVPHLYMPIVTDMQRAAGALACAVQEMERRFSLIRDVGVRNIEAYNEATKNDPDREHLPYIIIVIDEFADLKMSVANNDPENFTCRIAQKARAAGIHLIIGTQRPSVDVITGKLKTNIPSRIAFMVKQQVDSRTILDVNGAESLTGRGDMLYMASNSSDKAPVRVQGAYVSDKELEDVISYVRSHNDPVQYNQAFMDQIEVEMARAQSGGKKGDAEDFGDMDADGGEDPKFIEAVKLAVETQKVATSLLQRRIGVGYGRAAKIIDRMEELGLVSAAEGNKPRQILPAAQGYLNHIAAGGDMGAEDEGADGFDDYIS